jgi:hypothetical protein
VHHPVADGVRPPHGLGERLQRRGVGVAGPGVDVVTGLQFVARPEEPELERAGAGVDDQDAVQAGQTQLRTSGTSSPNSRV